MSFQINFNGRDYGYDLGHSQSAISACEHLTHYKSSQKYDDLKAIFANLCWIVDASPEATYNKNACLATRIFALSVFPTLNSNYEKFFVANSVNSIYQRARFDIPKDWLQAMSKYGNLITNAGLDVEEAKKAGLVLLEVEGKVLPV
jgi:hypothetical protein